MNKIKFLIALMPFILVSVVLAQPGTTINNVNALVGATNVQVTVAYLGTSVGSPNGVVGFQAKFTYNNTKVQVNATGLDACNLVYTCTDTGSAINMVAFTFPSSEVASSSLDIGFDLLAGAVAGDVIALNLIPGPTTVNADGEEYVDFGANPVTPVGSTNGSITVTAAPAPIFTSTPADTVALTTINVVQNFGTQTSDLVISNTGNAEPLTGSCSLTTNPSTAFSLSGTGTPNFSLLMGGTDTATVTVACNNTLAVAAYNGTLTCTSNGGADTTYPLVCNVTAPGPAVYGDSPAAGTTTNLTLASGPLLGGSAQTVTGQDLVLSNTAGAGNNNLEILSCVAAGAPEVTVTNPIANNTMIAPGASAAAVTFACDVSAAAAAVATFTKTYTCSHAVDGASTAVVPSSVYTYTCGTRAAAATGSQSPADTTTISLVSPPGGTSPTSSVTFSEVGGEGVAITNLACSITGSAGFTLTAPPATIPAGGSVSAVVSFTDPAAAGPYTDTLSCTYTDATGVVAVSFPLVGAVRAIIVPTLSWLGYAAMMLGLLFVGFVGFRRRA